MNLLTISLVAIAAVLAACLLALVGIEKPAEASFPGVNGKIAFTRGGQIHTMNAGGTNQTNLTEDTVRNGSPSWSPDNTKIAFESFEYQSAPEPPEIWVMNADGSGRTNLTNDPAPDRQPTWSPDGTQLAFTSNRNDGDGDNFADDDIWVMNANGSGTPINVTTGALNFDGDPTWSPDGNKIAFDYLADDSGFTIGVVNADGSGPPTKLTNSGTDHAASWSPDGTMIAFESRRDNNSEIYVMNADGSGTPTNLTNTPLKHEGTPEWSPDGTKIAFVLFGGGDDEIYVMNADGSGTPTNLTNTPGPDNHPSWGSSPNTPSITLFTPADNRTYNLNQSVTAEFSCQDEAGGSSGLLSCVGTVPNGDPIDTATVGSKTFTVSAASTAGNTASKTHTYSVLYPFSGFFTPVDNYPTLNVVPQPAGRANQLLRFSLGSDEGLDIFAHGYPLSKNVACPSQFPTDVVEDVAPAEPSNLIYTGNGKYTYSWKTEKTWKGTCRELNLKLKDGSDHKALFQFTR